MLIDTHCHIFTEYFEDIDSVIERCNRHGVGMIIVNGTNRRDNEEVLELVKKYDIVYGALGIQPEEIDDYTEENLKFIEEHIDDDKILAVGEIGLDYHYECDKELQRELFKKQLNIAKKHNKPVIIHSRDCIMETYNILKETDVKGIMHCYSGSVEMAEKFIDLGFFLGIGGVSTFKNANKIIDVIKNIPLEYIVLETDAPYLSPEPYRGKRNEPCNVTVILKKICEIKGIDYKVASDITTRNVFRLFDKQLKL